MARRSVSVFSLSFLDCMSCGFGAVVLFFMIIQHLSEERADVVNQDLISEVVLLEQMVRVEERDLFSLMNSLKKAEEERRITQGRARRVIENIEIDKRELAELSDDTLAKLAHLNKLKADVQSLEVDTKRLMGARQDAEGQSDSIRAHLGDGDRLYVTGTKVGGARTLLLVDASASMLDETIVNIVRRRNMSDADKRAAPKWRRTRRTVDWIVSQIPQESEFGIVVFNESVNTLADGWADATDPEQVTALMAEMDEIVPEGGTSLQLAFEHVQAMRPRPENIFLITDGLPTQGDKKRTGKVTSQRRLRLFEKSLDELPADIPVNVILMPMEGDPRAAWSFWALAQVTGGSFLSPARDWP